MERRIDTYRDGGTVRVDERYYIDRRIDTDTPYAVYDAYPDKGKLISGIENLNEAHMILSLSVPDFNAPNELIAIAKGLTWINKQIWEIEDVEKQ